MELLLSFIIILLISLFLAYRSMHDIGFSDQMENKIRQDKIKGTIVFFEDKVQHFRKD